MNFLIQKFNSIIRALSHFILLFSQVISYQIAFYPIIFLGILINFKNFIRSRFVLLTLIFVITMLFSAYLRGGSLDYNIKMIQFFLGILFVSIFFKVNKSFSIESWMIYMFVGLVFYEVISTNVLNSLPFFYDNLSNYQFDYAIDAVGLVRAKTASGFFRAFGPALNSSVSGSILAILFFVLIDKRRLKPVKMRLKVLVFSAMVGCLSATAFVVFISVWAMYLIRDIKPLKLFLILIISLTVFACGYVVFLLLIDNKESGIDSLFAMESIEYVFYQQYNEFAGLPLFGLDITPGKTLEKIGGDTAIYNAISVIGVYGLLGLFLLLMYASEKGTRIYIIAGFIASLHYGALFFLTGQFFFAAILNNAIIRK